MLDGSAETSILSHQIWRYVFIHLLHLQSNKGRSNNGTTLVFIIRTFVQAEWFIKAALRKNGSAYRKIAIKILFKSSNEEKKLSNLAQTL